MKNLRTHGKSTVVWLLMGLLILGLGGFGVTSFSGGSSEIGSVGETKITADEYARALQSQINEYSRQTGQPLTMAQAASIGLPQAVQAQLFTGAALEDRRAGSVCPSAMNAWRRPFWMPLHFAARTANSTAPPIARS